MTAKFGKNKKIHLLDPLYFSIFEDWCLLKIREKESVIAESVLASHLFRAYKQVFYWQNREEVDCVIRTADRLLGYECKWQENVAEKRLVTGKLRDIWTLSKKDFKGKVLPLSLFLYSLKV
jgi:predicted AAA+ superfamily ATPase